MGLKWGWGRRVMGEGTADVQDVSGVGDGGPLALISNTSGANIHSQLTFSMSIASERVTMNNLFNV